MAVNRSGRKASRSSTCYGEGTLPPESRSLPFLVASYPVPSTYQGNRTSYRNGSTREQNSNSFLDNFTELTVRMRGFGICTRPRMHSHKKIETSGSHPVHIPGAQIKQTQDNSSEK